MHSHPVVGTSGLVYGAAVIPRRSGAEKPIFVSVGHMVCLRTAVELVHWTSLYRIPEAIRKADGGSREVLRMMEREEGKKGGKGGKGGKENIPQGKEEGV
jgi:hypothetical protein